jgi:hypothetical protein
VKGFVYNALEACSQHLEQFGGHVCRGIWKKKIIPCSKPLKTSTGNNPSGPATSGNRWCWNKLCRYYSKTNSDIKTVWAFRPWIWLLFLTKNNTSFTLKIRRRWCPSKTICKTD